MNLNGKVSNPGELRTVIVLKRPVLTEDAGGFKHASSYTTLDTVFSKWVNAHGAEVWQAQSVQAEQPATVLLRYCSELDTTCLVERSGQLFQIVSIDDIQERHEYMELKVTRMVNG